MGSNQHSLIMGSNSYLASGKIKIGPENLQFLMETNFPNPIWQGLCYIIYWRVILEVGGESGV